MPPPLPPSLLTPTSTFYEFDSDHIIQLAASPSHLGSVLSATVSHNIDADLLDVFTTTVFVDTGPTVTANSSNSSKVPVGAIVGGLLGGVAIALLTVGGWIWWGRIIERKAKRDRKRSRKTSTISSIERGDGGTKRVSGSINGKDVNGRESARTSKRSLQHGVHPFLAMAATASQKSVTFADDEAATAATDRDNSEVKISISIAEKDKLSNHETEKERDIGKTTASPPVRGFSIRGSTPTPPPPARRSHSSERGYIPTRRSPLGQSSPSPPSPSPSLSARRRTPSAPQPGTGEASNNLTGTEAGVNGKHKSSPPAARSLSVLPIFGSKDADRGREGPGPKPPSPSFQNNTRLFLTRTPVFKSNTSGETHIQNQAPVSVSATPVVAQSRSTPSPVPPSPAKASVSLSLPGGSNLTSLNSLPPSHPVNPGSVNEALAALSSLDMTSLSKPRPAFRQGTYATSSVTQTNSSGISGASESVISAPSSYSQSGTATDIDPRIANRR